MSSRLSESSEEENEEQKYPKKPYRKQNDTSNDNMLEFSTTNTFKRKKSKHKLETLDDNVSRSSVSSKRNKLNHYNHTESDYEDDPAPSFSKDNDSDPYDEPTASFSGFSCGNESTSSISMSNKFQPKSDEILPPAHGYGKAEKMLKMQGYKSGEGLGKHKQGRVEPIGMSSQQGKRGIGFVPISQGTPYDGPGWESEKEIIIIEEKPIWMDESPSEGMDSDLLEDGMKIGEEKLTIDDENKFCDPKVLNDILSLKTLFDKFPREKLRAVVGACNLYESIENVFFLNRAALKMANMDAVFDKMFTNPKTIDGESFVKNDELLYFADVCAGPGGFTEYVLWRNKWKAKGFGFTLRGNNDFKLSHMLAAPTESFFPYYGAKDNGDIFDPENLDSLKKHVLKYTDDKGVHFLMGDGGFSVEGEENIQEIKSKQLYLCQCIAALSLVRTDGHFVVKLFDIFTEFSVGLIYLMYRSFKRICIHKPVTSRPANSERYLICKWKRNSSDTIERYLIYVNGIMWKNTKTNYTKNKDINKLVDLNLIKSDRAFFKYVYDSNNRIGREQIISLLKINENHLNPDLLLDLKYDEFKSHEEKKKEIRESLLKFWEIPDKKRKTAKKPILGQLENDLIEKINAELENTPIEINQLKTSMKEAIKFMRLNDLVKQPKLIWSVYDWHFMFCNNKNESNFNYYLGLGGLSVYKYDVRSWKPTTGIILPEGTLILAEDVAEQHGAGKGIHKSRSLHIIDAYILGYEPISHYCLTQRNSLIKMFCESMNRPEVKKREPELEANEVIIYHQLRSKTLYNLPELPKELNKLTRRLLKDGKHRMTASVPSRNTENRDMFFVVDSLMFFKFSKDPWSTHHSKTADKIYYHNSKNNETKIDVVKGAFLQTFDSLRTSFLCQYNTDPNSELSTKLLHRVY